MIEIGYVELDRYILSLRGGYKRIRELTELALPIRKKVRRKELTKKLVMDTFKKITIKKGRLPSKNDFLELGREKVAWFIQNNGGYRSFQRLSKLSFKKFHKTNQPSR